MTNTTGRQEHCI